jgi:hypothetical protein
MITIYKEACTRQKERERWPSCGIAGGKLKKLDRNGALCENILAMCKNHLF